MALGEATTGVEPLVCELATVMEARVDEHGADIAAWMLEQIPEWSEDDEIRDAVRRSALGHVGGLASLLRYGIPAGGIAPPRSALEVTRLMVRRGQPVTRLVRSYHLGQERLWQHWLDAAFERTGDPVLLRALLKSLTEFMSAYLDEVREAVVRAYVEEQERWTRSVAAVRERAVRRILEGEEEDPDRAGRDLSYDVRRHHVAVVLWAGDEDAMPTALSTALDRLAERTGGLALLSVPAALATRWAWFSSYARFTPAQLSGLLTTELPPGVRAATGEPRHGLAGFRESHLQARQAARVVELGAVPDTRPVAFRDVALASVVAGDLAAARRFADAELGPIDATGARSAALHATLAAVLDARGNQRRAAEALGVHEKTVAYRVRRIEELLGYPLAARRAEVELAVLVRRIGSAPG